MNVFGIGPMELVVIMIVALIFVGPERLPRLAADLARTIREIRKYTSSLASEFNEVVQEIERETQTDVAEWKEIGEGLSGAAKSVSDEVSGAQADAAGTPAAAKPPPSPASANGAAANGAARTAPASEPDAQATETPR
jgi:sec-independent protein translocase protein TatB